MRNALVSLALVALLVSPVLAATQTQQPAEQQPQQNPAQKPMQQLPAGHPPVDCQAMMKMRSQMHERLGSMDAELQRLVAQMNQATGQAKVDAMAMVINTMVEQRTTMRTMMEEMQPAMMRHMGEHMRTGMQSMTGCPMMKDGQGAAPKPPAHQH